MTVSNTRALIRHLPVGAAIAVAVVAAVCFAVMPGSALEPLVWRTGIAALIPAAQPPLGLTARAVLALATAGVGAAVTWSALFLLVGPGGLLVRPARRTDGVPVVRRADAHPDAPPRRPMSAADLGTPLMEVSAANPVELERSIPAFVIRVANRTPTPSAIPMIVRKVRARRATRLRQASEESRRIAPAAATGRAERGA